jgi:uncharacterized membrane protein (UPF0127 family)
LSAPQKAAALLAAALAACSAEPAANVSQPPAQSPRLAPSGLELAPLTIHSRGRVHRFEVEVARTIEQQARGLMFRERLGDGEGMIFPFEAPRPASFWMSNTLIALDMLFIRADGTIARIARRTTPLTDDPVRSGEPVAAVLELRGGRTEELGIEEGDRVAWPG